MRDSRSSLNHNCIFVLPANDTVELLISYRGRTWRNENINKERLRSFSDNCEGFNITFFEDQNGKILLFSKKKQVDDSIKISFEKIDMKSLRCSFINADTITYDNFELPASTTEITLSVGMEECFLIEWEYKGTEENSFEYVVDSDDEEKKGDGIDAGAVDDDSRIAEVDPKHPDGRNSKQKKLLEGKKILKAKLELDLAKIEKKTSKIESEITELMKRIDTAKSIQKERSMELDEKQHRINTVLADLGMDMDTLDMYSVDDSLENLLSEAASFKDRLEKKLESLIKERQQECDERSNRLKGSA